MNSKKCIDRILFFCAIFLLFLSMIPGMFTASEATSRQKPFDEQEQHLKELEAIINLGTLNRAQQAYSLENNSLATDVSQLDTRVVGKFYTYKIEPQALKEVSIISASPIEKGLPAFSSAVWVSFQGYGFSQIICDSPDDKSRLDIKFIGELTKPRGVCPDKTKQATAFGSRPNKSYEQEQRVKEIEAKANLGTLNRSQQAYALENRALETDISQLDARVVEKFYTYKIEPQALKEVSIISASPVEKGLPAFSSAVWVNFQDFNYSQIICESPDGSARIDIKFIGDLTKPKGVCPDKTKHIKDLWEL